MSIAQSYYDKNMKAHLYRKRALPETTPIDTLSVEITRRLYYINEEDVQYLLTTITQEVWRIQVGLGKKPEKLWSDGM